MSTAADVPAFDLESLVPRRRLALRVAIWLTWVVVIGLQLLWAIEDRSLVSLVAAAALATLCVLVNAQLFLVGRLRLHHLRGTLRRLHDSAYLGEHEDLPNRNYLLAELRREMPWSRTAGRTFTLLLISFEDFEGVCQRRGADFGSRGVNALVSSVRRLTRGSDFLACLEPGSLGVMLNECSAEQAIPYVRRLPATVPVSNGRDVFDIVVQLRLLEYDRESIYASDVLRELEASPPMSRYVARRPDFVAA